MSEYKAPPCFDIGEWVQRDDGWQYREDPIAVAERMSTAAILVAISDATIALVQPNHARRWKWEEARAALAQVLGERIDAGKRAADAMPAATTGPTCEAVPNVPAGFPGAGTRCGLVPDHEGDHKIEFGDGRIMTWEKR